MYAPVVSDLIPELVTTDENTPVLIQAEKFQCEEVAPEMHPVAEHFYRANGYKIRLGRHERVFLVRFQQHIIAAARLLPRQQETYWLRNMLVTKEKRDSGVGSYLMRAIMEYIAPNNCYCFALPEVVGFYQRLGFLIGMPNHCPADIAAEYRKYKSRGRDWVLMYTDLPLYQ